MRNAIAGKNGMFHLTIDGEQQNSTLFDMIRNTHQLQPNHTVVAYSDNAAVMQGHAVSAFSPEQAAQPSPAQRIQATYLPASHFLMRLKTPEKTVLFSSV
jgi:phosphoribosylformylglycinamidine synthase